MSVRMYHQTFRPFSTIAESGVTSETFPGMDATMIVFSLTTSSGTASRWTIQGIDGTTYTDGFKTALTAADPAWQTVKVATAQGYGSFDTIPRWFRFQRTPSASSTTFSLTIYTGS